MSDYKKALQVDTEVAIKYYISSLETKFEHQKVLEKILLERSVVPASIADIACGGGARLSTLQSYIRVLSLR